ncbi:MAG: BTAD domain-containing putative transcriptional regulator [Actinomycetota bacterium]
MVQLRLLGPLQVLDDNGDDITPPGARERLALATLAVDAPSSLSNERLATELYRGRETSDPRNAVQAVVSRLRRALGRHAHIVETTAGGYRLVDIDVDVDEAQELLSLATAAADPQRAHAHQLAAEELRRGPTLEGLDGDLVDAERLRVDNLFADTADAVTRRRLDAGRDTGLVAELEAAVGREPGREQRWELLMLALYRQGRQADALRAFQRARRHLANELGLEPGPTLVDLEQRILAHDESLAPPTAPLSPAPPTTGPASDPSTPAAAGGGTDLPSGTVTVLLCDVEGSVRRWEAEPVDTAADIATMHQVWETAVAEAGGHVVKSTGDGVLAVFDTAEDALAAGTGALRRPVGSLSIRAAAFTGGAQPIDGDYRGPLVNRCARLLDLAHGGQFLVPAATAALAQGRLPDDIEVRSLGRHRLRDVAEPHELLQVSGPGLAVDFPPLAAPGTTRLPRLRTSLVGREELVTEVIERLDDRALVTLLGPGGVGKTSLALAVAWRLADLRPVVFIDLARATEPGAVVEQIVEQLPLPEHTSMLAPIDRITDRLAAAGDVLVIDNAEHLLDAVAEVADALLDTDSKGALLVTSRQPLGLTDEELVAVPPLDLPADDDDLTAARRSPSVQLFVERVRATGGDREIAPGLLPVVAHICRRLDGLPLAIELAAGRSAVLSIEEIAARLDDQLRLLRQLQSKRDRRHRSLEAVVRWSAEQLSPQARELFDRLSVMAGAFDVAAAEGLSTACGLDAADVLDSLDELVGASLLVAEPSGGRIRMLEPIRQFAAAELAGRSLIEASERAHLAWVSDLLVTAHQTRDEGRAAALAAVDAQASQISAALDRLASMDQPDLILRVAIPASVWFLSRDAQGGERLLGALLDTVDREDRPYLWANVVTALAVTSAAHPRSPVALLVLDALDILDDHRHPDVALARVAAAFNLSGVSSDAAEPRRLLAEAEELADPDDRLAQALIDLGAVTLHGLLIQLGLDDGDVEEAIERGERAADALERLDEKWAHGLLVGELGRLHQARGDHERAEARFLNAIEQLNGTDFHGRHYILSELGRMATGAGNHERAGAYHDEAYEIAADSGHPGCIAMALAGRAHAAEGRGEIETALDLYRQAVELADQASLIEQCVNECHAAITRLDDDGSTTPA